MNGPRIGILTRHCYPNYGSFLQTRALVDALSDLGAVPTVIDYVPSGDSLLELPMASLSESRLAHSRLSSAIYLALQAPNLAAMWTRFRAFQKAQLPLSRQARTLEQLDTVLKDVDVVLVGSDQVWNTIHGRLDDGYYLVGVGNTLSGRYTYAASFGGEYFQKNTPGKYQEAISRFDEVSLREESAVKEVQPLNDKVRRDVDPVMLHSMQYWQDYADRHTRGAPPFEYILVYRLHNTEKFESVVQQVASEYGAKPIYVTADIRRYSGPFNCKYMVSPQYFVKLFERASAIVTDSFHGSVFATLFGRPLAAVLPGSNAERIIDFLSLADHSPTSADRTLRRADLEYDAMSASHNVARLRDQSRCYLERILESCPNS